MIPASPHTCSLCGAMVGEDDLRRGLAVKVGEDFVCPLCIDRLPTDTQVRINQLRAARGMRATIYRYLNPRHPEMATFTFATAAQMMDHHRLRRRGGELQAETIGPRGSILPQHSAQARTRVMRQSSPATQGRSQQAADASPPARRAVPQTPLILSLAGAGLLLFVITLVLILRPAEPAKPTDLSPEDLTTDHVAAEPLLISRRELADDPLVAWQQLGEHFALDDPLILAQQAAITAVARELEARRGVELDLAEAAAARGDLLMARDLLARTQLADHPLLRDNQRRSDALQRKLQQREAQHKAAQASVAPAETEPLPLDEQPLAATDDVTAANDDPTDPPDSHDIPVAPTMTDDAAKSAADETAGSEDLDEEPDQVTTRSDDEPSPSLDDAVVEDVDADDPAAPELVADIPITRQRPLVARLGVATAITPMSPVVRRDRSYRAFARAFQSIPAGAPPQLVISGQEAEQQVLELTWLACDLRQGGLVVQLWSPSGRRLLVELLDEHGQRLPADEIEVMANNWQVARVNAPASAPDFQLDRVIGMRLIDPASPTIRFLVGGVSTSSGQPAEPADLLAPPLVVVPSPQDFDRLVQRAGWRPEMQRPPRIVIVCSDRLFSDTLETHILGQMRGVGLDQTTVRKATVQLQDRTALEPGWIRRGEADLVLIATGGTELSEAGALDWWARAAGEVLQQGMIPVAVLGPIKTGAAVDRLGPVQRHLDDLRQAMGDQPPLPLLDLRHLGPFGSRFPSGGAIATGQGLAISSRELAQRLGWSLD